MTFNFQDRLHHAGTRFKEVNAETLDVTLKAGWNILGITASPVLQEAEEMIPNVGITRIEYQDWFIDVADYDPGSGPVLPAHGDTFKNTSTNEEFRVISFGTDEPPYRFTTSDRRRMRVHTERAKVA